MIDTILISTFKEIGTIPKAWTESIIKNKEFGTRVKWYYNPGGISFTYYPMDQKLFIETSLPKQVYFNNYEMLTKSTLEESLFKVKNQVEKEINAGIPDLKKWFLNKVDLCFNFNVREKVGDYLEYFSKCRLSKRGTPIYFKQETVTWKSTTKGVKFYDKQKESKTENAAGILRYELRLQHQTTFRRILGIPEKTGKKTEEKHWWWKKTKYPENKQVLFEDILKKELVFEELNFFLLELFPQNLIRIESDIHLLSILVKNFSINKAFKLYGMIQFFSKSGLNNLEKDIPSRTYQRIKSEMKNLGLNMVMDNSIKPLKIELEEINL